MGGFSIVHWLVLLSCMAWAFAVAKILKRIGFSPLWGILAVFPLVNLIGIWFVAFGSWPLEEQAGPLERTFQ